ncbi:MAG: cytochrome c peroxidase [Polyangiaceae bacterium]
MSRLWRAVFTGGLALSACTDAERVDPVDAPYEGPALPWAYSAFPERAPEPPATVELGRLLFYDPILSGDQETACATCHSEEWGMGDGLAVSIGVDGEGPTGPGRTGPNQTTRNALTLWNAVFRFELFWDGRVQSLEDQALKPLLQEKELALDPKEAARRIGAIPAYRALFRAAFPGEDIVTPIQIARALSAFERTLISDLSPYDRYVGGDEGALSDESIEGMTLFAEAGCASCHVPPLFESNRYVMRIPSDDPGRAAITGDDADEGAFRVPTLRNLRETGPYFHDGSVVALEDAVLAESQVSAARGEGKSLDADEAALVAGFLKKALMDRSREPTRPDEVPSGLDVPRDGLRIPR